MALTEGDKAQCMEIARAIIKEVLDEHVKSCPHGFSLNMLKAKFIGVCIGVGVVSSGISAVVLKIFTGI